MIRFVVGYNNLDKEALHNLEKDKKEMMMESVSMVICAIVIKTSIIKLYKLNNINYVSNKMVFRHNTQ